MKSKYLVRPDDFEIFSLNEDGETYTVDRSKVDFPNNLHNKYEESHLLSLGFIKAREDNLQTFRVLNRDYYKKKQEEMARKEHEDFIHENMRRSHNDFSFLYFPRRKA